MSLSSQHYDATEKNNSLDEATRAVATTNIKTTARTKRESCFDLSTYFLPAYSAPLTRLREWDWNGFWNK